MKRRALISLVFIIACVVALLSLAFASVAADEEIVVGYYEKQSGAMKEKAIPNEDGTYTLRLEQFSKASTVTLSDGTVINREMYGWFTEEGDMYAPGETVTFTKSTKLFQAYGVTVYNFADLKKAFSAGGWVKLGCDMVGDSALTNGQTTSILDLNGFNYSVTNNQGATWGTELGAFGCTRGSYAIMGKGTITQGVRTKDTNNGKFFASFATHGYADENNPQDFWVGKDVTIITPYPLLRLSNQPKYGMPDMKVAGTIEATQLLTAPSTRGGTLDIFESANITLTGKEMVTISTLDVNPYKYLTVTIHGGTINMAAEGSMAITKTMLECCDVNILGGTFAISDEGAAIVRNILSDSLMLTESVNNEVTYFAVAQSDCQHNYVLDEAASVIPTMTEKGCDVFNCSLCGKSKEVITIYNPSSAEIAIKVMVGEELVEKQVALGSVITFEQMGYGEDIFYIATAISDTDAEGNQIVSIEIPFGIAKVSITEKNTSVEELLIADGADVKVVSVALLDKLTTIKVGAANVVFGSGCLGESAKNSFKNVISDKAGATVTFETKAFYYYDDSPVSNLVLSSGSTYYFGSQCFFRSKIENIIFPDGADVTFTGDGAFEASTLAKYIYCGDGVKNINRRPFDYMNSLEVVIIMNSATIEANAFRVGGAENAKTVLSVYCHSADVTIHKDAFVNRNNFGVNFYTIDPDIVKLEKGTYKIFSGIPHAYFDGVVREATCVLPGIVGSVTDCPCGVNSVVTYTIYTADGTTTGSTAQRETELATTHVLGTVEAGINYPNGYLQNGKMEYLCKDCGIVKVVDENSSVAPMFDCLGYSVYEGAVGSLVIGFRCNKEIMNKFKEISDATLEFGVFAASKNVLGDNEIFDENGKAASGVLSAKTSIHVYSVFELKVTGFENDTQKAGLLALGAYVMITDGEEKEISCMQPYAPNGEDKYFFASYNDVLALTQAE